MLTVPSNIPPNSTTPLPADYYLQSEADLYNLYAAGLTAKFASDCVPPPSSFDFGPAQTFTVVPNLGSPALSSASSGHSTVNPMVKTVAQTQSTLGSMLVNRNQILTNVVNNAGGQGASYSPADFADAAEVLPMGPTASTSVNPGNVGGANGATGNRALTLKRRPARGLVNQPQPPWGGAAQSVPGGCQSVQNNPWAKVLIAAGLGIAVLAILND